MFIFLQCFIIPPPKAFPYHIDKFYFAYQTSSDILVISSKLDRPKLFSEYKKAMLKALLSPLLFVLLLPLGKAGCQQRF